jgi:hypothetical protein
MSTSETAPPASSGRVLVSSCCARVEAAIGRGLARAHLAQFLLALLELLLVERQQCVQLGQARLVQAPLLFDDAALVGAVARGRCFECRAFGERPQPGLSGPQREALRCALAHAGGGARLVDLQQELVLLDDLAFFHEDLGHDAAVERLHELQLA